VTQLDEKPSEKILRTSTKYTIVDADPSAMKNDQSATGCEPDPVDSLSEATLLTAPTHVLEKFGAAVAEPRSEIIGPAQAVDKSSALHQLLHGDMLHGDARATDQQKTASPEGLENIHLFNARYLIGEEIGKGGMGLVYRGWDLQLQRDVAIKIIRKDHQGNPQNVLRFLREARIASQLRHPSILGIHDFDVEPSGSAYIIMDLISGKTIGQVIAETIDDESKRHSLISTFFQICQAIAFAHANGVVHRDLKPANIMVGDYGMVTVLDWGLAKIVGTGVFRSDTLREELLIPLTQTNSEEPFDQPNSNFDTLFGTVMGSPYYLAPEQARGEVVDYRADVFSLGGILCHLITGSPPFVGNKLFEVFQKSVSGDMSDAFDRLDRCGAPIPIVHLAKRCLDPNVTNRPHDASFLVESLKAYLESGQRRAEEELVRFFDLSLDLFCIANTQGYFWRLNDNFSRTLGFTTKELTSKPFIEFVHPDDRLDTVHEITKLSRGEPTIQFINRYLHKNGHYISLEWTARSVEGEGVIYAVARDVSERLHLEEEKRRVEADYFRLSEIVESASDAIIGKSLDGLVQSWIPLDISVSISPIRDASGKVIGASKIARNIATQKKLESELEKSRKALVEFAENANVPLHCLDHTGTIVWANNAELNFLGFTSEEYIGQPIARFHAKQETISDIFKQLTQGKSLSHYRAQLIAKDGSIKDVAIYASAFQETDSLIYTRCFTIDLTPLRCQENTKAKI
jgi:serine/threonine-protein kinase